MDDPRDEHLREDEIEDDALVEEAAEKTEDSVPQDEQTFDEDLVEGEVEPAEEDQVDNQIAAAGLKVRAAEGSQGAASEKPHTRAAQEESQPMTLFKASQAEGMRSQWFDIQSGFIDSPRASVEAADQLIEKVMDAIRSQLSVRRSSLQSKWNQRNGDVTTEELRQTIQQYRSLLERLLEMEI